MKELALAMITYSSVDFEKFGLYKFFESPDFRVMLLAYRIDEEDIEVVDFHNRKKVPLKVMEALHDVSVIKYTYGFEFERVILSKRLKLFNSNKIGNWRSTFYMASYLGLPYKMQDLCSFMNIKVPNISFEYYKNMFSKPVFLDEKKLLSNYSEIWEKLIDYCKWMIKAELQIRKRLIKYVDYEKIIVSEDISKRVCSCGVDIDIEKLNNNLEIHKNAGLIIGSRYNIFSNNYKVTGRFKDYCKFVNINYKFDCFLNYEYKVIENWLNKDNIFYDMNCSLKDMKLPEMLLKVVKDKEGIKYCLVDYGKMQYEIVCWLADSNRMRNEVLFSNKVTNACMYGEGLYSLIKQKVINSYSRERIKDVYETWKISNKQIVDLWEKLKLIITFVLLSGKEYEFRNLVISRGNGCLWIKLPSGKSLCYSCAKICNDKNKVFAFKCVIKQTKEEFIQYGIDNILKDIVQGIINDLLFDMAKRCNNIGINVVGMSKEQILLEMNESDYVIWDVIRYIIPKWAKGIDIKKLIIKDYREEKCKV